MNQKQKNGLSLESVKKGAFRRYSCLALFKGKLKEDILDLIRSGVKY